MTAGRRKATRPPTTQASAAGPLGDDGWYKGPVQITLSASDNLTNVRGTYYTVDGGGTQVYAGPFTVSGNGVADEYGVAQPSGAVLLKADGTYSFALSLPATRNAKDADGHKYTVTIYAADAAGNSGSASAVITVL